VPRYQRVRTKTGKSNSLKTHTLDCGRATLTPYAFSAAGKPRERWLPAGESLGGFSSPLQNSPASASNRAKQIRDAPPTGHPSDARTWNPRTSQRLFSLAPLGERAGVRGFPPINRDGSRTGGFGQRAGKIHSESYSKVEVNSRLAGRPADKMAQRAIRTRLGAEGAADAPGSAPDSNRRPERTEEINPIHPLVPDCVLLPDAISQVSSISPTFDHSQNNTYPYYFICLLLSSGQYSALYWGGNFRFEGACVA
jgi:hypothetical protein